MTISTLDAKAALVVIDLQKGIVGMPVAHPIDGVIRNAVALAEAFRYTINRRKALSRFSTDPRLEVFGVRRLKKPRR